MRRAAAERRFTAGFLQNAENGTAREADLEDAVDRGVLTLAKANSLRAARAAEDSRRQDRLDLVTTAQQAID